MKIKVVIKKPYEHPYIAEIENELEEYQRIVGGHIETVPFIGYDDIVLICNEEGKLDGLEPNIFWKQDVIFGTVIAVGVDCEEFADLPEGCIYDVWLTLFVKHIHTPATIRRATGYADGV